jgi:hypothetical protein
MELYSRYLLVTRATLGSYDNNKQSYIIKLTESCFSKKGLVIIYAFSGQMDKAFCFTKLNEIPQVSMTLINNVIQSSHGEVVYLFEI